MDAGPGCGLQTGWDVYRSDSPITGPVEAAGRRTTAWKFGTPPYDATMMILHEDHYIRPQGELCGAPEGVLSSGEPAAIDRKDFHLVVFVAEDVAGEKVEGLLVDGGADFLDAEAREAVVGERALRGGTEDA